MDHWRNGAQAAVSQTGQRISATISGHPPRNAAAKQAVIPRSAEVSEGDSPWRGSGQISRQTSLVTGRRIPGHPHLTDLNGRVSVSLATRSTSVFRGGITSCATHTDSRSTTFPRQPHPSRTTVGATRGCNGRLTTHHGQLVRLLLTLQTVSNVGQDFVVSPGGGRVGRLVVIGF